ncbi:MAG TPA: YfhO family protein [Niastella sp.]
MNKELLSKLFPHFIAVTTFLIVATLYCRPVLDNQVLQQSDNIHWKGMAQGSFEFKEKYGRFPLWTNNLFSGMPAYQIAIDSDIIVTPNWFYHIFTLFLPKPISFFFLASICFYFLTQILRINPYIGLIGGLAYAYSTYNPIIISVGHDTKMMSIALMPAFIASLILIYNKKYLWGAALTAIFTALLVGINHVQVIYYMLIIATVMTVAYIVKWVREKDFKHLFMAVSIALLCGILGTLSNAITLLTTYESSKTTIRGGSELADKSTAAAGGVTKEYAFSYSMYPTEAFVMLVPKVYGGSDGPEVDEAHSKAIEELRQMPPALGQQLQQYLQFYWGGIGDTAGPPYVGAIICFLALFGFLLPKNEHKWWILAASGLAILMSWGGYFESFNGFLFDHLPLYNKFRAPSMIIIVPTFLFCLMAVLALQTILFTNNKTAVWDNYKKTILFTGSLLLMLLLFYFYADYTTIEDKNILSRAKAAPDAVKEYIINFFTALKADRKDLFGGSLIRSFLFITAVAVLTGLFIKGKIKAGLALAGIGCLAFIDVMAIDVKYLNKDNYLDEADYQQTNFTPSPADQTIMQDKTDYRVLDLRNGVRSAFNASAMSGYFHKSIGGYHPAKLSIYQDLIERQLYKYPDCSTAINMLNTKYIIDKDSTGKDIIATNNEALGVAWFVQSVQFANSPEAVMNALHSLNPKKSAIVFGKDKNLLHYDSSQNSSDTITLIENKNDEIVYGSNATGPRFAVFSEIFYEKGWKAYIDNTEVPIIRTNYVLRGLSVPAGQHRIRFAFHPASYYNGQAIAQVAGIITLLMVLMAIFVSFKKFLQKKDL